MWNEGLKVHLKPVMFDSSSKSSANTSLDISTDIGLPTTSGLHNYIIRKGRPRKNKASQSQLIKIGGEKSKVDAANILRDYLNKVSSHSFKSIPTPGSALID